MSSGLGSCPFRSPSDTCVTTSCELWNDSLTQCGLSLRYQVDLNNTSLKSHLTSLIDTKNALVIADIDSKFLGLLTYLRAVAGTEAEASSLIPVDGHSNPVFTNIVSDVVNLLKHYNADHNDAMKSGSPAANSLLMEYMGREDLDGNNKMYLVDFIIDENDPDRPNRLFGTLEAEIDTKYLPVGVLLTVTVLISPNISL